MQALFIYYAVLCCAILVVSWELRVDQEWDCKPAVNKAIRASLQFSGRLYCAGLYTSGTREAWDSSVEVFCFVFAVVRVDGSWWIIPTRLQGRMFEADARMLINNAKHSNPLCPALRCSLTSLTKGTRLQFKEIRNKTRLALSHFGLGSYVLILKV
jgi:hypothetical protein